MPAAGRSLVLCDSWLTRHSLCRCHSLLAKQRNGQCTSIAPSSVFLAWSVVAMPTSILHERHHVVYRQAHFKSVLACTQTPSCVALVYCRTYSLYLSMQQTGTQRWVRNRQHTCKPAAAAVRVRICRVCMPRQLAVCLPQVKPHSPLDCRHLPVQLTTVALNQMLGPA